MDASPASSSQLMGPREWLLLGLLSILWGGSFLFAKVAVAEWPPLAVVLVRVGVAAVVLNLAVWMRGLSMAVGGRMWLAFLAMGLLNNLIPFGLIFWGQTQIASGLAAIINATTPLFGVVLAWVLGRSGSVAGLKIAGVLAGIAGVAILMGPDATKGLGGALLPQLACLGAALSYGLAGVYGSRFSALPPLVTATGQLSASTIVALPLVLLLTPPLQLPAPSLPAIAALLGLALLSTALAYVIFFQIMRRAGGANAMLVTFLIPISAVLLGAGILGEVLMPRQFLGMAAILLGLALIDGRVFAGRPRPSS